MDYTDPKTLSDEQLLERYHDPSTERGVTSIVQHDRDVQELLRRGFQYDEKLERMVR